MSIPTQIPLANPSADSRTSLDDILESVASDTVPHIHNPTPDLQTLQGAYVQNIERLEDHAERMSVGSDLAEEIRKLEFEQKQSDSRRSSLQSAVVQDDLGSRRSRSRRVSYQQRSRNVSTSSYANSIVDVNKEARYGGYSPAGYVNIGSPRGSLHSTSWSQVSYVGSGSMSRSRSAAKGLRPMQTNHLLQDTSLVNSPIEEPFGEEFEGVNTLASVPRSIPQRMPSDGSYHQLYDQIIEANGSHTHATSLRLPSQGAFSDIYDEIAAGITKELDSASSHQAPINRDRQQHTTRDEFGPSRVQGYAEGPLERHRNAPIAHDSRQSILHPSEVGGRLQVRNVEDELSKPLPQIPTLGEAIQFDTGATEVGDRSSRPISAASGDTYRQAQQLFHDFDGAHAAPSIRESIVDASALDDSRPISIVHQMQPTVQPLHPPPTDGMVYYPAPVPRQLNLPQRLSQMPSASVQDQRRSQMLNGMSANARKSAIWLGGGGAEPAVSPPQLLRNRSSLMGLASTLPPQLRASMFFENPSGSEEVRMHEGGALATLDDLLDASALAPVAAFTHHPFAGEEGAKIYKKDPRSRESVAASGTSGSPAKTPVRPIYASPEKSIGVRAASFMGFAVGKSPATPNAELDALDLDTEEHSASRKKSNRKLNASRLEVPGSARNALRRSSSSSPSTLLHQDNIEEEGYYDALYDEGEEDEEDDEEAEKFKDEEVEPEYVGPPTTLLAELQYRKAHQKTRNLTAATAFPNGMHSTLLELDAVAQLEKAKRKKTRVALAWEDPEIHKAFEEPTDDEVPLGILFAKQTKAGLPELNRPLGLLERKAMEDNEPLSNRRNRILGVEPLPRSPVKSDFNALQIELDRVEESDEDPLEEGETLAQRVRRLKTKKELDTALNSVTDDRPFSEAFSTELFADIDPKKEQEKRVAASAEPLVPEPAEETLGQRRARLQREKDGLSGALPTLQRSASMADLLSAFPGGDASGKRGPLSPDGRGLLQKSEESRATKKQALRDVNLRSASYGNEGGLEKPLVDITPSSRPGMKDRRKSGGFANGIYNNGIGGEGMNPMDGTDRDAPNMYGNAMGMGAGNGFIGGPTTSPYATPTQQPLSSPYGIYGQNMNMSMPYLAMAQQQQPMYMNPMMAAQASMMSLQDPTFLAMQNQYMMMGMQMPATVYGNNHPPPLSRNQSGLAVDAAASKRVSMSSVNLLQNLGGGLNVGRQQMPINGYGGGMLMGYGGRGGVAGAGAGIGAGAVMPIGFPEGLAAPLDNKQRDRIENWRHEVTGLPQ